MAYDQVVKIKRARQTRDERVPRSVVTDLGFAFGTVVGLFIVFFRDSILPEKFANDSSHIQRIALGIADAHGDKSYENVALIYSRLELADHPILAGLFGFGLYFLVVFIVWQRVRSVDPVPFVGVLIGLSLALGSVFLSVYSKDVFLLPLVAMILLLGRRWWNEIFILVGMILYAMIFRNYWYLVAVLYCTFRLLRFPRNSRFSNVLLVMLALILASVSIFLFLHQNPDYFRVSVNLYREGQDDASTIIQPFVDGPQPISGITNVLVTFVALLFPFPLVLLGGIYYPILALTISLVWISFVIAVDSYRRLNVLMREYKLDRWASFVFAFLCVQALFEPDYGSALRHVTPLLPLVVCVAAGGLGSRKPRADAISDLSKAGSD